MCTISIVMDDWTRRHQELQPPMVTFWPPAGPSREEFDALKAEVESMKKLLIAAKLYDKETGQPDCESEDKIALFRKLAQMLGVDISEIFTQAKK